MRNMQVGNVATVSKSSFAARFEELRAGRSLQTVSDALFDATGNRISPQAMHKWLQGGRVSPESVQLLARFFRVSEAWLAYGQGNRSGQNLEELVRALPHDSAVQVLDFLRFQVERNRLNMADESCAAYIECLERLRGDLK